MKEYDFVLSSRAYRRHPRKLALKSSCYISVSRTETEYDCCKSNERRVKGSRHIIAALIEAKSLGEDWFFLTRGKIEYIPSRKVAGEILGRH